MRYAGASNDDIVHPLNHDENSWWPVWYLFFVTMKSNMVTKKPNCQAGQSPRQTKAIFADARISTTSWTRPEIKISSQWIAQNHPQRPSRRRRYEVLATKQGAQWIRARDTNCATTPQVRCCMISLD
jgi:hypothetical protein